MLTYIQVRDACPDDWSASGEEWLASAGSVATSTADEPIDDPTALACRASALVCQSLSDALRIAQHCLLHAVQLARSAGLTVDEAGGVHEPAGVPNARLQAVRDTAEFLIAAAVRGAGEAEQTARALLHRFAGNLVASDLPREIDLGDATRGGQDMLAGLVPMGSPDKVAAWWGGLADDDRHTLILAVPARLAASMTGVWPRDRGPWPVRGDDAPGRGIWTGWHWLDEDDQVRVPVWAQARASRDFWSQPDER